MDAVSCCWPRQTSRRSDPIARTMTGKVDGDSPAMPDEAPPADQGFGLPTGREPSSAPSFFFVHLDFFRLHFRYSAVSWISCAFRCGFAHCVVECPRLPHECAL